MNSEIHLTVAAIIEHDHKFLMVEETSSGRRVFNQPAGHLEQNESLREAVVREVQEETAWGFRPEFMVGIYSWRHPIKNQIIIRFTYSGTRTQHSPNQALDKGIHQALWMSHEEISELQSRLRSPLVTRCLDDYLGNKRFPLDIVQDLDFETVMRYAVAV